MQWYEKIICPSAFLSRYEVGTSSNKILGPGSYVLLFPLTVSTYSVYNGYNFNSNCKNCTAILKAEEFKLGNLL